MRYQAFISYKHAGSHDFAERLELALKGYAKPLWRPPISIFRDEKYLKPGLDLPGMIQEALGESEFLIYLASPAAAHSPWVQDELRLWCAVPARREKLIIVLTEGTIAIEEPRKTIAWERTDAVPDLLRESLTTVPFYLDCSRLGDPARQTLLDPDFKIVVNAIVAAFRNVDPITMSGEEILQHRKNIRNRNLLVGSVFVMMLAAAVGAGIARQQAHEAATQSRIAKAAQLASEAEAASAAQLPQRGLLLAAAAAEVTRGLGEGITPRAEQTLRDLLGTIGGYGLAGHTGSIDRLAFIEGGAALLSFGEDGQVLLWQLDGDFRARGKIELIRNQGRILASQIHEKERTIRFVTQNGHVLLRSLDENHAVLAARNLPGFLKDQVCATKVTPSQVLQVGDDAVLRSWSLDRAETSPPEKRKIAADALSGCTFSEDGGWLYVAPDGQAPIAVRTNGGDGARKIVLANAGSEVSQARFSPQSRQIALAMKDGRILLRSLDPDRAKASRSFQIAGKKEGNLAIAYSRSGRTLAVAGAKGTIDLFRVDGPKAVASGATTVPFEFYRGVEGELSFERADTLLLASDGLRASAAIFLSGGAAKLKAYVLYNHPSADDIMGDRATPYAVHPSRPILATAGNDHNASIWSLDAGTIRRRDEPLRGHDHDILALAFSPDGRWLATAGRDRMIRLWPVEPPQWTAAPAMLAAEPAEALLNPGLINPGGGVHFARFFPGDEWFESHDDRSRAHFGRMDRWARLSAAIQPTEAMELPAVKAETAWRLGSRSGYPPLHRHLLEELHRDASLPGPLPQGLLFEFDGEGRAAAEAAADGTIRLWELDRRESTIYRGLSGPVTSLSVCSRCEALAAVNQAGQIARWQIGRPEAPRSIGNLGTLLQGARPLDSRGAASGGAALPDESDPPSLWFLAGSRWLHLSYLHQQYLMDLQGMQAWRLPEGWHQSGVVAECCVMQLFEDRFDFWRLGDQVDRPVRIKLKKFMKDVTAYDYDAVRGRLALGFLNGQVKILEIDAAGSVTRLADVAAHDFIIGALALSSDGRRVAAGSIGGITLTELAEDLSITRHIRLQGHRGNVGLLRFSPGDTWLLSGGEDNRAHVHPVSADRLLEMACEVAGRSFSAVERGRLGDERLSKVCSAREAPMDNSAQGPPL